MFHSGSANLAHNLDRFSPSIALNPGRDYEFLAVEAARLRVETITISLYVDWYGLEPVIISRRGLIDRLPAYEAEIRTQILGERFKILPL